MSYFKPVRNIGAVVMALLAILLLLDVLAIASSYAQFQLLDRMAIGDFTWEEAEANDQRQALLGFAWLGGFVVTCVAFLVWTYRIYGNVDALGGTRTMSPGWGVGAWFVPILNLFRPYRVVRESWSAAALRVSGEPMVTAPFLLPLWWGLWIVNNILGNVTFRLGETDQIPELKAHTLLFLASDVANLAAAAAAIAVVAKVSRLQTDAGQAPVVEDLEEVFG